MSIPTDMRVDRDNERTHVYALTKYVFAKDCNPRAIGGEMKMTDTPTEPTIFGIEDKDEGVYFTRTKGEIKRETDQ